VINVGILKYFSKIFYNFLYVTFGLFIIFAFWGVFCNENKLKNENKCPAMEIIMKNRISILDGLRFVSILLVMLFHYYSRFYGEKYTYSIDTSSVFHFGYLGVQLFFIISGFVITMTLMNCDRLITFFKKRFIRLVPGMLVCATLTFLIVLIFDTENLFPDSGRLGNLLLSYTFLKPGSINEIFGSDFRYIDGAYWSLWVEITFYIVVSILYFINKKKLLRNYFVFAMGAAITHYIFASSIGKSVLLSIIPESIYNMIYRVIDFFNLAEMALWFLLGMILLKLYNNKNSKKYFILFTAVFLFQTLLIFNLTTFIFCIFSYIILITFIYKPEWLSLLSKPLIAKLGLVSYCCYLHRDPIKN